MRTQSSAPYAGLAADALPLHELDAVQCVLAMLRSESIARSDRAKRTQTLHAAGACAVCQVEQR